MFLVLTVILSLAALLLQASGADQQAANVVTAGACAAVIIEGVKWGLKLWVYHDPAFEFPTKFYLVSIPVLAFVLQPALAWLGLGEYAIPTDWYAWLKQLVLVFLASVVSIVTNQAALSPLSEHARNRILPNGAEEFALGRGGRDADTPR